MAGLLKWFSVSLFLSLPFLAIYGIMNGDVRYLFVFLVVGFFSIVAGGFSDAVKKDNERTLF